MGNITGSQTVPTAVGAETGLDASSSASPATETTSTNPSTSSTASTTYKPGVAVVYHDGHGNQFNAIIRAIRVDVTGLLGPNKEPLASLVYLDPKQVTVGPVKGNPLDIVKYVPDVPYLDGTDLQGHGYNETTYDYPTSSAIDPQSEIAFLKQQIAALEAKMNSTGTSGGPQEVLPGSPTTLTNTIENPNVTVTRATGQVATPTRAAVTTKAVSDAQTDEQKAKAAETPATVPTVAGSQPVEPVKEQTGEQKGDQSGEHQPVAEQQPTGAGISESHATQAGVE